VTGQPIRDLVTVNGLRVTRRRRHLGSGARLLPPSTSGAGCGGGKPISDARIRDMFKAVTACCARTPRSANTIRQFDFTAIDARLSRRRCASCAGQRRSCSWTSPATWWRCSRPRPASTDLHRECCVPPTTPLCKRAGRRGCPIWRERRIGREYSESLHHPLSHVLLPHMGLEALAHCQHLYLYAIHPSACKRIKFVHAA
jgi:hypothetical protein